MRTNPPSHSALLAALLGLTAASCSESDKGSDDSTLGITDTENGGATTSSSQPPAGATSQTPATTSSTPQVQTPPQSPSAQSPESPAPSQTSDNSKPSSEPVASTVPPANTGNEPEPMPPSSSDDADDSPDDTSEEPDATDAAEPTDGMPPDEPTEEMNGPDDESTDTPTDEGGDRPDENEGSTEPFGPDIDGSCTASESANANANGGGPYDVVVETNGDPGINEGTIFRPATLGEEIFPIFVWGEGGCSLNGLSNSASMAEIASHGYFVIADGTPNGSNSRSMDTNNVPGMGEPLLAYIDWALAENSKPCSAYYHALDASKIASNGFSCGGLMSTGTAGDPRMTTWGSTSSGTFSADQNLYDSVHTPVLIISGGPSDIAYENGARDYENISGLGHPIMYFSKDIGHGGDLFQGGGGDFTKINLAWLNWWLKGDESETGKGVLVGAGCSYCSDSAWEVKSANLP